MATLSIIEVDRLAIDAHGKIVMAPQMPPPKEQAVSIGMSSTQSAAFGGTTRFVQVTSDTDCRLAWGSDPSASSSNSPFWAKNVVFLGVNPGDKLAVIAA